MDTTTLTALIVPTILAVGSLFVTRHIALETKRNQGNIYKRLDKHGDDIVALNTKSELAVTAKDVDEKFVSKELFKQFEKHIDSRFDGLEKGQGKILDYIGSLHNGEKR